MSSWDDVQARAATETRFVDRLKGENIRSIEAFYPELYEVPGHSAFTNTLGSDLIADVLTSRRVLVDLYAWPDEQGLIQTYGVDLQFLVRMRNAKLVRLCANLPVQRYRNCHWLYDTLADDGTIWRSVRTPGFFASMDPGFDRRRRDREESLYSHFSACPEALPVLFSLADPAHPPRTAAELAAVLSHWIERVVSFEPELAAPIIEDFEKYAHQRIPELKQVRRLVVSPYSAALGGTMKMWRHHWSSLFGEESVAEVLREDLLRSRVLLSYLSETTLGLTLSDLSAEQTWQSITEATRCRILDFLIDAQARIDLIAAEEHIRTGLAAQGAQDPTRDDIRAYMAEAERTVNRLERIWDGAKIALPIAFGAVNNSWLLAVEVGGGLFCSKQLLGARAQAIVENLIGKVQIVRTLKRH